MNSKSAGMIDSVEPTARIAQWVVSLSSERTRAVQNLATDGIRDLVGCLIGGSVEPTAVRAAAVAAAWGVGTTTIVGVRRLVPAPSSAFANGTAAHILDFDDSFAPLTGHPSAPLVPAVLALAEERGFSGAAVLDAYVAGIEVIATIGRVINPAHYAAGWHSTATIGVIGAAAACARLLGLDAEGVAAAISIAVSSSSGTRMQLGFPMKSIHAGFAARDGVVAAMLAAEGVRGNPEPLVGPRGLADLYSQVGVDGEAFSLAAVGDPLAIEKPGITFKPHPTCGSTHRSLDALLHMRETRHFDARDVEAVDLVIPLLNVKNLIYDNPTTGMEAKFSMHYCAAVALIQGPLRLGDFEDAAIFRPQVRQLMQRIRMHTLPGSENTSKDYLDLPAHTTVRLKSGEVLEDTRYSRQGAPGTPMLQAAQRAKFLDCATRLLSPSKCEHLLELISSMASVPKMDELMAVLRAESRQEPIS